MSTHNSISLLLNHQKTWIFTNQNGNLYRDLSPDFKIIEYDDFTLNLINSIH